MSKRPTLTSQAGTPATDNQNAQTAGPNGPVVLQDRYRLVPDVSWSPVS